MGDILMQDSVSSIRLILKSCSKWKLNQKRLLDELRMLTSVLNTEGVD